MKVEDAAVISQNSKEEAKQESKSDAMDNQYLEVADADVDADAAAAREEAE